MKATYQKVLGALVALGAAVTVQNANAYPQLVNSTTPDLTLIAWDASGFTYLRDLGTTWSAATVKGADFASSLNYSADANWATFLTDIGATSTSFPSGVNFDIVSGTTAPSGTLSLVTTLGPTVNTTPAPKNVPINSIATLANAWSNFAVLAAASSSGPNTHGQPGNFTVHGSDVASPGQPGSVTYSGLTWDNGFNSTTFPFTYGSVGSSLSFWSLSAPKAGLGNGTWAKLAGVWTLATDGTLNYTVNAVPEPGTWALLLAGMMAVGLIARRRTL